MEKREQGTYLSVDKLATKGIAEETEYELTDDVTDVCGSVDGTAQEERVEGRSLVSGARKAAPVLVGPDWGDEVDDEEIVGVEHEADTADGVELQITTGHDARETFWFCGGGILLLRRAVSGFPLSSGNGVNGVEPSTMAWLGGGRGEQRTMEMRLPLASLRE